MRGVDPGSKDMMPAAIPLEQGGSDEYWTGNRMELHSFSMARSHGKSGTMDARMQVKKRYDNTGTDP